MYSTDVLCLTGRRRTKYEQAEKNEVVDLSCRAIRFALSVMHLHYSPYMVRVVEYIEWGVPVDIRGATQFKLRFLKQNLIICSRKLFESVRKSVRLCDLNTR